MKIKIKLLLIICLSLIFGLAENVYATEIPSEINTENQSTEEDIENNTKAEKNTEIENKQITEEQNLDQQLPVENENDNSVSTMSTNTQSSKSVLSFTNKGVPINIDGYYDDWSDKPVSWHYNWDNSQNCWYWGCWLNGVCYKTPEGTYDNNVRHLMQMYSDGEYIYVHIKIATIYESLFNGEDYNFYFNNDARASFQITDNNGQVITNNIKDYTPGIHPVQVRHRDSSCSYGFVDGAVAYLTVYDDYKNTDLEFKIPLSQCKYQNNDIDLDNLEVIKFFTPNLMYEKIESHGTPTYPFVLIGILVCICIFAEIKILKNRR